MFISRGCFRWLPPTRSLPTTEPNHTHSHSFLRSPTDGNRLFFLSLYLLSSSLVLCHLLLPPLSCHRPPIVLQAKKSFCCRNRPVDRNVAAVDCSLYFSCSVIWLKSTLCVCNHTICESCGGVGRSLSPQYDDETPSWSILSFDTTDLLLNSSLSLSLSLSYFFSVFLSFLLDPPLMSPSHCWFDPRISNHVTISCQPTIFPHSPEKRCSLFLFLFFFFPRFFSLSSIQNQSTWFSQNLPNQTQSQKRETHDDRLSLSLSQLSFNQNNKSKISINLLNQSIDWSIDSYFWQNDSVCK